MARKQSPAPTTPAVEENAAAAIVEASGTTADLPDAPEHRRSAPVAPRGGNDATQAAVDRIRQHIIGTAYSRSADYVQAAQEAVRAVSMRDVQPAGREYQAEALDYLAGKLVAIEAQGE